MSAGDLGDGPSARCAPIERRRRPTCTGRGSRLCASAWRWRPDAAAEHRRSARLRASSATSPTVVIPRSCSLAAVTAPTPQSRSTGNGCRNVELAVGRNDAAARRAWPTAARDLGQELGPGDADGDAEPDRFADARAGAARRSRSGVPDTRRRPPTSRNASSIDRPSTSGVVSLEHLEHRLARLAVGREARAAPRLRRGHSRRAWRAAHRGAHAVGLGLVAGRQHDAAADDHRPAPQLRVVALLDRRVERVEVGVQDALAGRHATNDRRIRTHVQ